MIKNNNDDTTLGLTRGEFGLFTALGRRAAMPPGELRRMLGLTEDEWMQWLRFLHRGPTPAHPSVPEMLLRLAEATFLLAQTTENQDIAIAES